MTPEEQMALTLMGADAIQKEIDAKKALLRQLVGGLYPAILANEIAQLQALLARQGDCRLSAVGAPR